jgi:hypothetical protein
MSTLPSSFLSPKCESRRKPNNQDGVFATKPIKKGELIAIFGGLICDWDTFQTLPEKNRSLSIQVEDQYFLVPEHIGQGDYFNHSCDPNAGLSGQIALVAMRDIAPAEEVRFDYAMSDGMPYDEFDCDCGAPSCRRHITGNDWQIKELQERYAGYFSPYLQRHIEHFKIAPSPRRRAVPYNGLVRPPAIAMEQP